MTEDTDRESWIEQTTASLRMHLPGYTEEQCRELAELLYGVPDHPVVGTMGSLEQVLYALLRQQGLDEASAAVIARATQMVDWSRIFIGSRAVFGLLDVTPSDLLKYRRAGTLVPAIEHRTEAKIETLAYSLADILMVVAMDRVTGERAVGKRRFRWKS